MNDVRVLVVDDEASARTGLEKLLRQAGYIVDTAKDGKDALAVVADHPPEVIVTDLNMPEMDGMTLLGKLRDISVRTIQYRLHEYGLVGKDR